MKKILMATHLGFAKGILETLELIVGNQGSAEAMCVYTKECPDITRAVNEYMEKLLPGDEVIVITDIYGGSVNNEYMKHISRPGFHLIAGLNLPLLIELVMNMDMDTPEQIRTAIERAGTAVYCSGIPHKPPREAGESCGGPGI